MKRSGGRLENLNDEKGNLKDDVKVAIQKYADEVKSFIPEWNRFVTPTTINAKFRRIGEIKEAVKNGVPTDQFMKDPAMIEAAPDARIRKDILERAKDPKMKDYMKKNWLYMGDPDQSDVKNKNGLVDACERLIGVDGLGIVHFTEEDIFRHPIVAAIEEKYKT